MKMEIYFDLFWNIFQSHFYFKFGFCLQNIIIILLWFSFCSRLFEAFYMNFIFISIKKKFYIENWWKCNRFFVRKISWNIQIIFFFSFLYHCKMIYIASARYLICILKKELFVILRRWESFEIKQMMIYSITFTFEIQFVSVQERE